MDNHKLNAKNAEGFEKTNILQLTLAIKCFSGQDPTVYLQLKEKDVDIMERLPMNQIGP